MRDESKAKTDNSNLASSFMRNVMRLLSTTHLHHPYHQVAQFLTELRPELFVRTTQQHLLKLFVSNL